MAKKRMIDGLLASMEQAVEHAQGNNSYVRETRMEIKPITAISASQIRNIRMTCGSNGYTQDLFAKALGVTKKAVEAWESGAKHPSGTVIRVLQLVQSDPHFFERAGIIHLQIGKEKTAAHTF